MHVCVQETKIYNFCSERTFSQTKKNRYTVYCALDFHWEDYGFQIHIPAGAFRRPVTLCIEETISFQMMIMILLVVSFGSVSILAVKRFDRYNGYFCVSVSVCLYTSTFFLPLYGTRKQKRIRAGFLQ